MPATNSILALAASTSTKDKDDDDEQGGENMTPALLRRLALTHDGKREIENLRALTSILNSPSSALSLVSLIWWLKKTCTHHNSPSLPPSPPYPSLPTHRLRNTQPE